MSSVFRYLAQTKVAAISVLVLIVTTILLV